MRHKIPGIIGGIGPESTVDYYKLIISGFLNKTHTYPFLLINSINMNEMLDYVKNNQLSQLVDFLLHEINKLLRGGADFVVLASNTPHIVFDELKEKSGTSLISIVEETCKGIQISGLKKVGLFGTLSTMQGGFYQETGRKYKLSITIPENESRNYIGNTYLDELARGIINQETKKKYIEIAYRLKKDQDIEGLILGGTELPLILNQEDFKDLTIFNTTKIHVDSILSKMLE